MLGHILGPRREWLEHKAITRREGRGGKGRGGEGRREQTQPVSQGSSKGSLITGSSQEVGWRGGGKGWGKREGGKEVMQGVIVEAWDFAYTKHEINAPLHHTS